MGNLLDSLSGLVSLYPAWTYAIIGAGMVIQGEITIVIAMYLVAGNVLTWQQFFVATFVIYVIYENLLYLASKAMRHTRFGWGLYRKYKSRKRVQLYTYFLKKNLAKLLVIAKFVPGMNFLVITLSGWSKTSFRAFLASYFLATSIWFIGISTSAYFVVSGLQYLRAAKIFKQAEIVGIAAFIIFILVVEYFLRKLVQKRALEVVNKEKIPEEIMDEEEKGDFWEPRNGNGKEN